MPSPDHTVLFIRPALPSDSSALSRICLLTADAGKSAEINHSIPELPGIFYAAPYVKLPYTMGFVLVRRYVGGSTTTSNAREEPEEGEAMVGYILFAYDTRKFEDAAERDWFRVLHATYPKLIDDATASKYSVSLTDDDKRYISLLHAPGRAPDACIVFSPAHLHINILPEAQRQGWGNRLIDSAVRYLRDEKGLTSVWLGMDPRNTDAARFYERSGFKPIEGAPSNFVGLKFEDWASP